MSVSVTPALEVVSVTASINKSSAERSQCSPKAVQPIAIMATRSQIPCAAMSALLGLSAGRAGLPEVVVHPVFGCGQPPEGHFDLVADRDVGTCVGQFAAETAPALEVDDRRNHGRAGRVGEPVDG